MTMARKNFSVVDDQGNIVNGATITVRREIPGQPLAAIKSDRAGTTSMLNPYVAADGADAGFYAAGGAFKITATLGAFTKTWRYEPCGLASETDTPLVVFTPQLFGALADGSNNDAAAINSAIAAVISAGGGEVFFPAGTYKTDGTQLLIDLSALTTRFQGRIRLRGEGAASVISNATSAVAALKFLGRASNPEGYLSIQGLRFKGNNVSSSKGIEVSICAFGSFRDVIAESFDYGVDATDMEQVGFYDCEFRFNSHALRLNAAVSVTDPNSITFVNTAITNNTVYGALITHANAVDFFGGSIQYNGTIGGGTGQYGITLSEAGSGYGTVNFVGVVFEGNGGAGDLISDQTTYPCVVNCIGCSFLRVDLTTVGYGTNNINAKGSNANAYYNLMGNTFLYAGTYVQSAGRPTIALTNTSAKIRDDGTNYFKSATEKLTYPVAQIALPVFGNIAITGKLGIGGTVGNSMAYIAVPNNAGTSNAIRFIDDGAASSSTSNNSYGIGVNPSTGAFVLTAGSAGSFQMYTANTQRFSLDNSGNVTFTNATVACDGYIKSSSASGGVGYATGAGDSQVQATSKSTTVVSNKPTGKITMNAATLNAGTIVSFTLTNSAIAATDLIMVTHESAGTTGAYTVNGRATGAGTAAIDVRNNTGGNLGEAIVLRFAVIKSINA